MANTYETQFTRENVQGLNKYVQDQIAKYAVDKDTKMDLFVIVAALQQAAYEITLRSLVDSKEEAELKTQAMLPLSQKIVSTVDDYRMENASQPTEEMLGAIFGSNVLIEFYAHNRDEKISALMKASEVEEVSETAENIE